MTSCRHLTLVMLPEEKAMLRCRRCHLTISTDELNERHCPECFEEHGRKSYDFEHIDAPSTKRIRYRCEQCGVIIETE